jgi:glycosyltransferase involved in cell wall biosynthesis
LKFSIVTCTWNSAATLEETIRSVSRQSYSSIEHIFVDGGSTDGTLEIIERFSPCATVIRGVSGGVARAMNVGARAASGDVVAHLHADDYYCHESVVSRVATAFGREPGAQWLHGRIKVLGRDGVEAEALPLRPFTYSLYAQGMASVPHPAVFLRRAVFERFDGFDETLKYAMDIDLWLRLGRCCSPLQLDEALTVFREHPGSLSTANVLKARAEELQVRRRYFAAAPWQTVLYMLRYLRRTARIRRALAAGTQ